MSGFSPEWLALREPADHRSRNSDLARLLMQRFAALGRAVEVVDLGCGTGSNLRAAAGLLGAEQNWTLVDYDPALLAAARKALSAWAKVTAETGDTLTLAKGQRRIAVTFRQADLARDLDAALGAKPDLVTAAAFFDLASRSFIGTVARAVAARRAAFYTVLTYNGIQRWQPRHDADDELAAAFHAHQETDKGFGPASGPLAPAHLAGAFRAERYDVHEGDSPWLLGRGDARLVGELATGFAAAAAETGRVDADTIAAWRRIAHTGAEVGHTDTFAVPR